MNSLDICFTPLDIPDRPKFDMEKFLDWAKRVYPQPVKQLAPSAESVFKDDYPWDLTFALFNNKWQDDFDVLFPELADYMTNGFGLSLHEMLSVIFLPVRPHVRGRAFWHNDRDTTGLRFYLECENYENNPLLLKKTKEAYTKLVPFQTPLSDDDERFQPEVYKCKMPTPHSAFYVNNFRAIHAPFMSDQSIRIAGFITVFREVEHEVRKRLEPLIVGSAEKYKDCAILYQNN